MEPTLLTITLFRLFKHSLDTSSTSFTFSALIATSTITSVSHTSSEPGAIEMRVTF